MATAKVDNKKRLTLKEARPGEVYDVEYIGGGHFKLSRLVREREPVPEDTSASDDPETVESEASS